MLSWAEGLKAQLLQKSEMEHKKQDRGQATCWAPGTLHTAGVRGSHPGPRGPGGDGGCLPACGARGTELTGRSLRVSGPGSSLVAN